jgi:hypothetical protein
MVVATYRFFRASCPAAWFRTVGRSIVPARTGPGVGLLGTAPGNFREAEITAVDFCFAVVCPDSSTQNQPQNLNQPRS